MTDKTRHDGKRTKRARVYLERFVLPTLAAVKEGVEIADPGWFDRALRAGRSRYKARHRLMAAGPPRMGAPTLLLGGV